MTISGFTFIHNGIEGGYPFVEAIRAVLPYVDEMVVVDMQSTDETRVVLDKLGVRIVDGKWTPGAAGECLATAHALHYACDGDVIWHFEADEVFGDALAKEVKRSIAWHKYLGTLDACNIGVLRLQVEQNFQRCRWYPEFVHRVFPNHSGIVKQGHTTNIGTTCTVMSHRVGFLWDVTNCFKDDWLHRVQNQAELWGSDPSYLMVPLHCNHSVKLTLDQVHGQLREPHWTWLASPFNLPDSLVELLGVTSYAEHLKDIGLL